MKLIKSFDPSIANSGTLDTLGVNTNEQLVVYNASQYALKFSFADGTEDVIPASWNKDFIMPYVVMGKVEWTVYNQLAISNFPISQVFGTLYESDEHVARVNAAMSIGVNLTNVGGIIANVTQTQTLYNNGFPDATQVVSCGVLNEGTATWTVLNDGTFLLFLRTSPMTYVPALQIQLSEPYVQLGLPTHKTQIDGLVRLVTKLLYDGSDNNLIDWSAIGLFLKGNPSSHGPCNYQSDGVNTDWRWTANSSGSGTSVNGSASFNHNLTVAGIATAPDRVFITPTGGIFTYAVTAKNATQFTLLANASQTFDFLAVKI